MNKSTELSLSKKLLFSLIVTVFFVTILEGIFRVSGFSYDTSCPSLRFDGTVIESSRNGSAMTRVSPELFWELRPGSKVEWQSDDRINEKGFRGRVVEETKRDDVFRIICIGDSCTLGAGISVEESYPEQLYQKLNKLLGEGSVEVLNTGVRGYSIFQMNRLYDIRLANYKPDLVIIYSGAWNDYTPAIGMGDEERYDSLMREKDSILLSFVRKFRIYQAGVKFKDYATEQMWMKLRKKYRKAAFKGNPVDGRRVEPESFNRILNELTDKIRMQGGTVILIVPPIPEKTVSSFPIALSYRDIIRNSSAKDRVFLVDMPLLLEDMDDKELFNDWIHPNGKAFGIMTDNIVSIIVESGIINEQR